MASHPPSTHQHPIETPDPHTDAYMDMQARRALWRGFGKNIQWQSMLLVLVLGYATLTLTMGVNWLAAMLLFAAVGVIGGLLMNMGGAWFATVFGLCVLGFIVQCFVWLTQALL